jgi:TENA/THI-4/PQQC family
MLIQGNAADWKAYVEHEFVKQLGMGTLSQKSFTHFITFVIIPFSLEWRFTSCVVKITII